jgi:hypothetical protein
MDRILSSTKQIRPSPRMYTTQSRTEIPMPGREDPAHQITSTMGTTGTEPLVARRVVVLCDRDR